MNENTTTVVVTDKLDRSVGEDAVALRFIHTFGDLLVYGTLAKADGVSGGTCRLGYDDALALRDWLTRSSRTRGSSPPISSPRRCATCGSTTW